MSLSRWGDTFNAVALVLLSSTSTRTSTADSVALASLVTAS
jgi:hypothetical protein